MEVGGEYRRNWRRVNGPPQIWWTLRIGKFDLARRSVSLGIILGHSASIQTEFRQSAVNLVLVEGLSARKAAKNIGITVHTIHSWVASARRGTSVLTSPTVSDPTARLRELEAANRARYFKKSGVVLCQGASMEFVCIRNELQPTYAVRDCCRVLVVACLW